MKRKIIDVIWFVCMTIAISIVIFLAVNVNKPVRLGVCYPVIEEECLNNVILNQNAYEDDYANLPLYLKKAIGEIIYTEDNLQEMFSDYFPGSDRLAGVTVGNTVYLDIKNHNDTVLIHEAWHCFDWERGFISENEDFLKLYERYSHLISHSEINPHKEFFASCGTIYTLGYGKLPDELIEYFDELVGNE